MANSPVRRLSGFLRAGTGCGAKRRLATTLRGLVVGLCLRG